MSQIVSAWAVTSAPEEGPVSTDVWVFRDQAKAIEVAKDAAKGSDLYWYVMKLVPTCLFVPGRPNVETQK